MKEIYQIRKVHPEVYQIMEAGLGAMYVICEEKQAVLVDTGTGISNLNACVRNLTATPFKVCVTHGHRDHFGGAGQFPEVYMAQEDWEDACSIDAERRRDYVKKMIAAGAVDPELLEQADIQEWDRRPRLHVIKEGDVICAGNWKLEVFAVPGHTNGSVAFFEREKNVLFSGDCANPIMVLRKKGSEKDKELVTRWLEKLRYVNSQINDKTLICAGHGMLQREVWKQLIEAAEGYLSGNLKAERRKIHFFDDNFIVWKDIQIMLG